MEAILFNGVVIVIVTAGVAKVVKALFFEKLESRPVKPEDPINTLTVYGETEISQMLAVNAVERELRRK